MLEIERPFQDIVFYYPKEDFSYRRRAGNKTVSLSTCGAEYIALMETVHGIKLKNNNAAIQAQWKRTTTQESRNNQFTQATNKFNLDHFQHLFCN